jgi:hypothetical protein
MFPGVLSNISLGGLLLKANDVTDSDKKIFLIFQVPPYEHLFQLNAVVVWIALNKSSGPKWNLGVKFVDLGRWDKKHLERCSEVLCNA